MKVLFLTIVLTTSAIFAYGQGFEARVLRILDGKPLQVQVFSSKTKNGIENDFSVHLFLSNQISNMEKFKMNTTNISKVCSHCKTLKTASHFYKKPSAKDGLSSYCKPCNSAVCKLSRARTRAANPPPIKSKPLKTIKICSVENCESKMKSRSFCQKHWHRWRRHGNPQTVLNIRKFGDAFVEKFWSLVAITSNPNKCWEWQGATAHGYGRIKGRRLDKAEMAHRVAFEFVNGYVPTLHVLHSCDNPKCVNPNHLREGTNSDNVADRVARGRGIIGEKNHKAKLTESDVREIKSLLRKGETQGHISRLFNVAAPTISVIASGKAWKHIE